jgi:preprotein translocase subunit SecD
MRKRNSIVFIFLCILFALSLAVVFPLDKGILLNRGVKLGLDLQGGVHLVYQADLSQVKTDPEGSVDGAMAILANRVNPMGVSEPVIQRQGTDRIVVELPGTNISDLDKEKLSQVDILQFGEWAAENETARWTDELGRWKPATAVIDGETKELSSRYFKDNTYVGRDTSTTGLGEIFIYFEFTDEGSKIFKSITERLIGNYLGIFIGSVPLRAASTGFPIAPQIQSVISDAGQITGLSLLDATTLSKQLNYGRLPVPLKLVYDETVSPLLGSDFVTRSVKAGIIGTALVMLFMILYYRMAGVVASIALVFYAAIVLAVFKLWPVTLSLAGIGGFVVSVGMAVDANVLIFERMKEEINTGRTYAASVEAGFTRAWSSIWDSNMTTFIVCGILYWLGSSVAASAPVMGFALTLFIGVAVSMFTAIFVSRTMLRLFVGTSLAKHPSLFASVYAGGKD